MSEVLPLATQRRLEREYEARYKSFRDNPLNNDSEDGKKGVMPQKQTDSGHAAGTIVKSPPSSPSAGGWAPNDPPVPMEKYRRLAQLLHGEREKLAASRAAEAHLFVQWRELEKERMRQEQRYKRIWGFLSLALCYAAAVTFAAIILASVVWGD